MIPHTNLIGIIHFCFKKEHSSMSNPTFCHQQWDFGIKNKKNKVTSETRLSTHIAC